MCYVSWMACPSLLLRLGLSQWRWPAWRRTKTHMVMLVVQADRATPSKHCASNPGVQPGKRWFCLHSFWADHPDLQGEWRRTWLRHSLSLQEEEKKLSWVQESLQVQLWLPHSPQGKLDFTFPRRLVQRSLETRCVGPSTGLWFPTEPLQDLIHLWFRAWPSASSVLRVMRPGGGREGTADSCEQASLTLISPPSTGQRGKGSW